MAPSSPEGSGPPDETFRSGPVVEVGSVAHGGHCVARLDGRVVFVRHALPGETVRLHLTEAEPGARFWRADAVEVLQASPDRVPSAWPEAGPGGVGGGELAHVALPAQRRWKEAVVTEQLRRLARDERPVTVEAAPGDEERGGLGWRTRVELVTDAAGRAGMHRHRSHDVVPLGRMPLAAPAIEEMGLFGRHWPAGTRLTAVAPAAGDRPLLLVDGVPWSSGRPDTRPTARTSVREVVLTRGTEYTWRVRGAGFWQVHREAPAVLVGAVLDAVGDREGSTVVDLYSGSGLLALPLADVVGESGRVVAVEGDPGAVRDARRAVHGREQVELRHGPVEHVLAGDDGLSADVVVLDPPRVGAGREVVARVAGLTPQRVVYVACDPAALARDVAYLAGHGYRLTGLRAFDLFPMTHHVECVAVLDRR